MEKRQTSSGGKRMESFPQMHLKDYFGIIKRRKRVVIAFSAILITSVSLISLFSPRTYKATTQLIIERVSYPVGDKKGVAEKGYRGEDLFPTQFTLLQSRGLALKVIGDLDLRREFRRDSGENPVRKVSLSDDSHRPGDASLPRDSGESPEHPDTAAVVDWYLGHLRVEPVPNTTLISVSFLSRSPELAARIANAHARAFIEENVETRRMALQRSLEWLENQLRQQRKDLEESQRVSHDYKRANHVLFFDDRRNIVTQQMEELSATLARMQTERLAKQAVLDQLTAFSSNSENIFSLPEVARDPIIQNLRSQLIQLKTKRTEMSATFGPKHPKMIDIDSGIGHIEEQLVSEVHRLASSLRAEVDRALANEKSLQNMIEARKSTAMHLNEKAIAYDVLTQEVESNQQMYDALLKQVKEVSLAGVFDNGAIRIVEEAEVPTTPVGPKVFVNILLAIMVSMVMGPSLAFFADYMDNTVRTPDDIRRKLGIPVLGVIPRYRLLQSDSTSPLFWDQVPPARKDTRDGSRYSVDSSYMVIQHVERRHKNAAGSAFFFVSAAPGEGKTTVLANIGKSIARSGVTVLMVDADSKQPGLHSFFGVKNSPGLANGIERMISLDISRGSLKEFSVGDLFALVNLRKMSGRLTVTDEESTWEMEFDRGSLYSLRSQFAQAAKDAGSILVGQRAIREEHRDEAGTICRATGKPLADTISRAGSATPAILQAEDNGCPEGSVEKLFEKRNGHFHFHPADVGAVSAANTLTVDNYGSLIRDRARASINGVFDREIGSSIVRLEDSLSLLPAGTASSPVNGIQYGSVLSHCMEIFRRRYDVVLVDTLPLLGVPDTPLYDYSENDSIILVIKAGHLQPAPILDAISVLRGEGAEILGAVLNNYRA